MHNVENKSEVTWVSQLSGSERKLECETKLDFYETQNIAQSVNSVTSVESIV